MCVLADPAIGIGVFVPDRAPFVTRRSDRERVGERLVLAGRVAQQVDLASDTLADRSHRRDLAVVLPRVVASTPSVDLEAGRAHLGTLLGEVGVRLRGVGTAVVGSVIRRGVGRYEPDRER